MQQRALEEMEAVVVAASTDAESSCEVTRGGDGVGPELLFRFYYDGEIESQAAVYCSHVGERLDAEVVRRACQDARRVEGARAFILGRTASPAAWDEAWRQGARIVSGLVEREGRYFSRLARINRYEIQPAAGHPREGVPWPKIHPLLETRDRECEVRSLAGEVIATWAALVGGLDLEAEEAFLVRGAEERAKGAKQEYPFEGAALHVPGIEPVPLGAIAFTSYFIELRPLDGSTAGAAWGELLGHWLLAD